MGALFRLQRLLMQVPAKALMTSILHGAIGNNIGSLKLGRSSESCFLDAPERSARGIPTNLGFPIRNVIVKSSRSRGQRYLFITLLVHTWPINGWIKTTPG